MHNTFLKVSGLSSYKITQVTAGWDFSIALTDEGRVFTWGSNTFGQLGVTGTLKSLLPVEISINAEDSDSERDRSCMVTHIVAGMRHSMALTISGDVFVWGAGRRGQLGLKNSEKLPTKQEKPKKLNSISGVQSLVAGAFHSGALLKDGSICVWGCNKYGQSTNMEVKMLTEPYKISSCQFPLSENDIIQELHSGWSHFLVLTERHQVISWGRCDYGQLGRPTDLTYKNCDPKPYIVEDLGLKVKQLCCGAEHNLALLECGSLVCWGWNEHGMCGNGNEINQLRPTKVQLPEKPSILLTGAGTGHSFALCSN
ncbi:secretion-regulating guanine nucleotide exchange factor isoform X2 [Octopus bimaculoides]|uniref:RCC1-like domain-containing protein n=2 Tax=Octopus bimaculoides TaxID=37653 RepID=A0A0L8GVM8_OCTBM|nr:secretion-regulating guanine nucleotide exchange factor isoform X2 [Octopus bimaculoides]XP_052824132.1 secretion-regulating guanine nucleotide exchange factor isoform X2 [Octopus bimaculoides]|eukprot:XP_014777734.1 PREDICTED: secretion-regulating guanine nucleotide exchange factor-like isoform X2 [Octopus bimaculoides]